MATPLSLYPAHTAVLNMDCQAGIFSIYVKDKPEFLQRAQNILRRARSTGMALVHVRTGFRPGLPEVSSRNLLAAAIKSSVQRRQLFEGKAGEIHPALAPEGEEPMIVKHRVSAFAGTDLEMILRARDVDTLVLFGISTSGVVLATLLEASDKDYRIVVIRDCCAEMDPDLHTCLLDKLFPRQAAVVTSSEFLAATEPR